MLRRWRNMNKKEWDLMLQEGEGYNLEFKESISDSTAKEMCAFANANGGKILMGVSDTGETKGIPITNRLKSQIYDSSKWVHTPQLAANRNFLRLKNTPQLAAVGIFYLARNFDPRLEISIGEIGNVLVIDIPEGANKPYSVNGKFYIRQGTNSQQLSREEIREFFQKEGLVLFDERLNSDFNLKKDFNAGAYRLFLEKSKISPVLAKEKVLENLGLIKNNKLKNAGVLLFCKKATSFMSNAAVICSLFQGTDKNKIIDSQEFDKDIYSNYENAIGYVRNKLNTEYVIKGGPREEILELPEEALREAILNAIAHRSYFAGGFI